MSSERTILLKSTEADWWQSLVKLLVPVHGSLADATTRVVLASYALLAIPYLVLFASNMALGGGILIFLGLVLWAYFMSRNGSKILPRVVIAFICPLCIYVITCMVHPVGHKEITVSARLLLLAQAVAPFLIYKVADKYQILLSLIFNALLLVSLDFGIDHFPYKTEGIMLGGNALSMLASLESILFLGVVFWTYKNSALAKEQEIQLLVDAFKENTIQVWAVNAALQESERKLAETNETKNKLFGIIAHDLRTPLNSFEGFSNLLGNHINELSTEEIHEMTRSLQRSFVQVKALLENLLSWSRSQMNLLESKPESVDLKAFLQHHAALYTQMAAAKHITLQVVVEEELYAHTDYNIFASVIRNLITNSIKYSHTGGSVYINCSPSGADKVQVQVRDLGVGMSNETLKNLFKIEHKTSIPGTQNEKGTGLGLILVRDFLLLLGSDLEVISQVGAGSTFSFLLERDWPVGDANTKTYEDALEEQHAKG